MGKKIKLREAQLRTAEQAIADRLRAHSGPKASPGFIASYSEFPPDHRARIDAYRSFALRAPEQWRCRLRSRSPERRFLELVQFTFARYPVAHHLENAWIVETHAVADQVGAEAGENDWADGAPDFRRWYIAVAQGGSLYREATRRYMSKLETHHFVNAHSDVSSTQRAFWYAFARAQTSDITIALRVARTKLAAFPVVSTFWQNAARFFARNPTSVLEMNDMLDFFEGAKREDDRFSLKGRALPALRRRMEEWHRALRDIKCGRRWNGVELPDVDYETGSDCERAIWRFRQIKTGDDLCREGQRMHHCVATYKDLCVTGALSIWSLTCECPIGTIRSGATIELDREGAIVQCRGFGNRLPTAEEAAVVKRWAEESGLTWASIEQ